MEDEPTDKGPGSKVGQGLKTGPRQIHALDKKVQALELRRAGKSYRTIASMLDVPCQSLIYKWVSEAMEETRKVARETAEEIKQQELERLDAIYEQMFTMAESGDSKAAGVCVQVCKRRSELLGLDATKQIEVGHFLKSYTVKDCSPDAFPEPPKPEDE